METPNGADQRQALAERMSKLLGLPLTQIQLLMPLIPGENLDHLAELGDADFLRESTKLINEAQMQQFQAGGEVKPRGAEPAAASPSPGTKSAEAAGLRTLKPRGGEPRPAPSLPPDIEPEEKVVGAAAKSGVVLEKDDMPQAAGKALAPHAGAPALALPTAEPPAAGSAGASIESKMPAAFRRSDTHHAKAKQQQLVTMSLVGGALAIAAIVGAIFLYQVLMPAKKVPTITKANVKPAPPTTAKPGPGSKPPKSTAVVAVAPVPPNSSDSTEVPPPDVTPTTTVNAYAWKLAGELTVTMDNLPFSTTADQPDFTVEWWLRAGKMAATDQVTIIPLGKGDSFSFALIATATGPHVRFAIPTAQASIEAALPATDVWTHVAGVYDTTNTKKLLLFINGQLASQGELGSGKPLAATGYQLTASVAADSTVLLDDLRISRSAMYNGPFEPERIMARGPQTAALLRMERDPGDENMGLADAVVDAKHQAIPGGSWVLLRDLPSAPPIKQHDYSSGELPPELLGVLEKQFGVETKQAFLKEWQQLTLDQKRAYLRDLGIRVE